MEKHEKTSSEDLKDKVEIEKDNKEAESEKLAKLKEEIEQLNDKFMRQLAETENLRSRSSRLLEEAKDYAIFSFSKDMVSIMDNLSMALEHVPGNLDEGTKNMIEGVKMTQNELAAVFKKHALELIQPHPGDKFDYNLHHAISQIMTDDYDQGTIVDTMQVGYKMKDRLIRPAAVAVSKKK